MSAQAHTEELVPLTVCRLDELPGVGPVKAEINGHAIAIVHAEDGAVYAIDDVCTHANVSLSEGELDGCHLECWLHGSRGKTPKTLAWCWWTSPRQMHSCSI